jgi:hypothetical protein
MTSKALKKMIELEEELGPFNYKYKEAQPMTLKKYSELGTVHRCQPCQEYPGSWRVYQDGKEVGIFAEFDDAMICAKRAVEEYDSREQDNPINVQIGWKCSDDDPRIGQIWFSGFYIHGKFSQFGRYVEL